MVFDHHQYVILLSVCYTFRSLLSAKLIVSRRKCKLRTLKSFIRQLELVRVSLVGLCSRTRNISARHLFFLFKGKLILLVKCPSLTLMRCSFNSCKTQTSRDTSKAPSQITSYAGVLKHLRGRLLPKVIYFIFIQAEWL